jgi:hypothetical protein
MMQEDHHQLTQILALDFDRAKWFVHASGFGSFQFHCLYQPLTFQPAIIYKDCKNEKLSFDAILIFFSI